VKYPINPNNWAIVIGINFYKHHPERRLRYAARDALQMRKFLCDFAGFAPKNIFLYLGDNKRRQNQEIVNDPSASDLTHLLTKSLLPEIFNKRVDRFWFFFAGHGITRNGDDFLLLSDSFSEDEDLKFSIRVATIKACLRKYQNAEIVLILDACRQTDGSRALGSGSRDRNTNASQDKGITTIYACKYGQFSYELYFLKGGSFTHALIEGLKQNFSLIYLEKYLNKKVSELNKKENKPNQHPQISPESVERSQYPLLSNIHNTKNEKISKIAKIAKNIKSLL
jgi:uncharacterized caspase-like protein